MNGIKGFNAKRDTRPAPTGSLLDVAAQASKLLVESPDWQSICTAILKLLTESFKANRAYLFYRHPIDNNDFYTGEYYHWPEIDESFSPKNRTPRRWINYLRKDEVLLREAGSFPEAEQKFLNMRKTRSMLAVSILNQGDWYGFICVETLDDIRKWSQDEIEALKCLSLIISAAMRWQAGRQKRRQHKDRFVLTMEKASCGIVYLDKDANVTYANEKICSMLGYTREEILEKNLYTYTYHEDIELCQNFVNDFFKSFEGKNTIEKRVVTKDGKIIWVFITCLLAVNPDVNERSYIAIVDDVTARREAQKKLLDSEQRFQIVSIATNDAIWDWNYETNTIWWNTGIETLFGYSANEVSPAYSWWEAQVHPQDLKRVLRDLDNLVENKYSYWTAEYRFKYGNGTYATVFDRAYIIYDEDGRAIRMIGSMQDITRQKKTEASLKNSREQLRNLAKKMTIVREDERKRLSRELHDEFAQILTALKMDLQWLGGKLPDGLEKLRERTRAMSEIVDTTMDRVRQIATELRPALIDDLGICAAIDWQLKEFYARTGSACSADIDIDENKIDGDLKITLFRIFQEALSNIARHTCATRVTVKLHEEDNIISLIVHDNGDGIPAAKLNDVHSIGLIGMRERAGAFSGELKIESGNSQGTTIKVMIPLSSRT